MFEYDFLSRVRLNTDTSKEEAFRRMGLNGWQFVGDDGYGNYIFMREIKNDD